jgi:hypothetical protein
MFRNTKIINVIDVDSDRPKEKIPASVKLKPRIVKAKDVEASPSPKAKAPVKAKKVEEAKVEEVKAPVKAKKIEEVKAQVEEVKVSEVKPKGRAIFEKGSEEAKQWGAMMREKRLAKKAEAQAKE